jgi:hypothetical protein
LAELRRDDDHHDHDWIGLRVSQRDHWRWYDRLGQRQRHDDRRWHDDWVRQWERRRMRNHSRQRQQR